jgi:hypothetical protein
MKHPSGAEFILPQTRRASVVGLQLAQDKLEEARRLSPSERLLLALKLSDACYELRHACSPKR